MPYNKEYKARWRLSQSRPRATCHPDKPNRARGLCETCYGRWLYANSVKNRATKLRNAAKWKKANLAKVREAQRAIHLKKRYGLDEMAVEVMKWAQNGLCAICQEPLVKFQIDHSHSSGQVRGLLCFPCNGGLSWVEEMLRREGGSWFERATQYLRAAEEDTTA